jgi:serine/threonine protein kinase
VKERPSEEGPGLAPADSLGPPPGVNRPAEVFVDELFDDLMDLPADERLAALERRTADESIRNELRALLAIAGDLPVPKPAAPPAPGDTIDHYRLGTNLGVGASGSVWTAYDTRLQAWTALKLFHGDRLPSHRAVDTVLREARAASGIISPNVVLIRNAGQDAASGLHFIEMLLCAEYRADEGGAERLVVGRSLADDPISDMSEVVRVVAEAARGTEAAHRVGVVHRDVKPANILVMPVSRRALVADFGLSTPELLPPVQTAAPTDTVSLHLVDDDRTVVGTPCFMSPEQARGEPATRQSDVYALGATLYTMLVRRAPYMEPGSTPDAMDIVHQVRRVGPTPIRQLAPKTPARLVRIVERAMARSPGDRYPTAAALADDLEAWRAHRSTSLDGRNPVLAGWLFARRNPAPVATGVVLSVMLLSFGVSTAWLAGVKDRLEADVTTLEGRRAMAEQQAAESEARAQFAARGAGAAARGAEEAANHSREAAAQATEARVQVEEVTAWARAQTEQARLDRQQALEEAARAVREAAEAEVARARAVEARAGAEMGRAQAVRDLAEARSLLAAVRDDLRQARAEREDEAARHRATLLRQLEAEGRLLAAEARVQALEARVRELSTGEADPLSP